MLLKLSLLHTILRPYRRSFRTSFRVFGTWSLQGLTQMPALPALYPISPTQIHNVICDAQRLSASAAVLGPGKVPFIVPYPEIGSNVMPLTIH
jgi:hypothetical protein